MSIFTAARQLLDDASPLLSVIVHALTRDSREVSTLMYKFAADWAEWAKLVCDSAGDVIAAAAWRDVDVEHGNYASAEATAAVEAAKLSLKAWSGVVSCKQRFGPYFFFQILFFTLGALNFFLLVFFPFPEKNNSDPKVSLHDTSMCHLRCIQASARCWRQCRACPQHSDASAHSAGCNDVQGQLHLWYVCAY